MHLHFLILALVDSLMMLVCLVGEAVPNLLLPDVDAAVHIVLSQYVPYCALVDSVLLNQLTHSHAVDNAIINYLDPCRQADECSMFCTLVLVTEYVF